jgi:sterol desaturase/sphingolipid hydroxylase (fatty acid hydroxylase superfamily)
MFFNRITRCSAPVPTLIGPILLNSHMVVVFIFTTIVMFETTIAHSGYELPYTFFDGKDHAYHHSHIESMYGSFFLILDRIMGTDKGFKEYLLRQAKKNALKAE